MSMMRLPQPGERWILRPREEYEALPCEFCGVNNFSLSSKRRFNKMFGIPRAIDYAGKEVLIVPRTGAILCINCGMAVTRSDYGMIAIDLGHPMTRQGVIVPDTWLEPLEQEAKQ